MIIETHSPNETFKAGKDIGLNSSPGDVYALEGDLGAGKTVFTKGIADGLGVTEMVSSPTFTILQEYMGKKMPFYHFDVYRIEDPMEMEEVGYDDYFFSDGVCVVEWAGLISEILPDKCRFIKIEKDEKKDDDYRRIIISDVKE